MTLKPSFKSYTEFVMYGNSFLKITSCQTFFYFLVNRFIRVSLRFTRVTFVWMSQPPPLRPDIILHGHDWVKEVPERVHPDC